MLEVRHQGHAQRFLRRAIEQSRLAHAYLFWGPEGVGKETFSRGLAQFLLCERPVERKLEPGQAEAIGTMSMKMGCGGCIDCRGVAAETHPDLHVVHRYLNREHPDADVRKRKSLEISVDVVRHFIIERVGLTPVRGRAKVFIVRQADYTTVQAQNALLKTLEEPQGKTYLFLLVANPHLLLPTTRSRCTVVRFDPLPTAFVSERLGELRPDLSPEQRLWYAQSSDGSLGRALQAAEDRHFELNGRVAATLAGLAQSAPAPTREARRRQGTEARRDLVAPASDANAVVKQWMEQSEALGERCRKRDPDITDTEAARRGFVILLRLAANWYADLLRCQNDNAPRPLNLPWLSQIEKAAESLSPDDAAEAVRRIALAERQLDLNANIQLCIECLVNDLAVLAQDTRMML